MVVKLTQGPPRIFRDACTLSISVSFFQLLILYPLGVCSSRHPNRGRQRIISVNGLPWTQDDGKCYRKGTRSRCTLRLPSRRTSPRQLQQFSASGKERKRFHKNWENARFKQEFYSVIGTKMVSCLQLPTAARVPCYRDVVSCLRTMYPASRSDSAQSMSWWTCHFALTQRNPLQNQAFGSWNLHRT